VTDFCEQNNETYGTVKGGKFLDRLIVYQLVKKDFTS
jgi:hypothetical protein